MLTGVGCVYLHLNLYRQPTHLHHWPIQLRNQSPNAGIMIRGFFVVIQITEHKKEVPSSER